MYHDSHVVAWVLLWPYVEIGHSSLNIEQNDIFSTSLQTLNTGLSTKMQFWT